VLGHVEDGVHVGAVDPVAVLVGRQFTMSRWTDYVP
jgi:hypothetical protein